MQQSTNQRNINKFQGRTKQPHHCYAGLRKGRRTTRQSSPCKAASNSQGACHPCTPLCSHCCDSACDMRHMTQTTIDQTSGCPAEPRHVGWRPQLTQTMPARHWYTTAALQQPHPNIMGVSLQTVFQTILGRWQAIAAACSRILPSLYSTLSVGQLNLTIRQLSCSAVAGAPISSRR